MNDNLQNYLPAGVMALIACAAVCAVYVVQRKAIASVEGASRDEVFDRVLREMGAFEDDGVWVVPGGRGALTRAVVADVSPAWVKSVGSLLTAVSLVITFVLLALVLGSVHVEKELDNGRLNDAIQQMGAKFFVSAAGVFGAVATAVLNSRFESRAAALVAKHVDHLFGDGRRCVAHDAWQRMQTERQRAAERAYAESMRSEDRALLERVTTAFASQVESQSKVTQEAVRSVASELAATNAILRRIDGRADESVRSVASIEASLQGGLEPLVSNVEKLAGELLAPRVEDFLERIKRGFGEELEVRLEPLRTDLRSTGQEAVLERLGERLQSAFTGGASDATASFQRTLQQLNEDLPRMLDQVRLAAVDAQESNKQVFAALADEATKAEGRVERLHAVVDRSAGNVRDVVDALVEHARETLSALSKQTETAVADMAQKTQAAGVGMAEQLQALAAAMASANGEAQRELAGAHQAVFANQNAAIQSFIHQVQQEAARMRDLDSERVRQLKSFNDEVSAGLAALREEQTAIRSISRELHERSSRGEAEQRAAGEVASRAAIAAERLERVAKAFADQATRDEALMSQSRVQLQDIRSRSEELEHALRRIGSEVASAMKTHIGIVNEDLDRTRSLVNQLLEKVEGTVVNGFAEAVRDLQETVERLEKASRGGVR